MSSFKKVYFQLFWWNLNPIQHTQFQITCKFIRTSIFFHIQIFFFVHFLIQKILLHTYKAFTSFFTCGSPKWGVLNSFFTGIVLKSLYFVRRGCWSVRKSASNSNISLFYYEIKFIRCVRYEHWTRNKICKLDVTIWFLRARENISYSLIYAVVKFSLNWRVKWCKNET